MFIAQAFTIKHDWWRYFIGIIIIITAWQGIGVIPLLVVGFFNTGSLGAFIEAAQQNFTGIGMDSNLLLSLMIFSFIVGLLAIWFVSIHIHEQKIRSLTTSRATVDWSRIFFSFFLVFFTNIILFVIMYFQNPDIYQFQFQVFPFLILLLIAIFLLPLQTSFEEYLFRGYLMQGIGVLAKNKWLPLIITSVIFGLLHSFNPEVAKLGPIMLVFYIGTGFLLGIMTLMDEGMELALGFHAANNMIAATLVTTDWSALQTDALFLDTSEPVAGWELMLPLVIQYPIYIFILAKKYGWKDWKNRLLGYVTPPIYQVDEKTTI